ENALRRAGKTQEHRTHRCQPIAFFHSRASYVIGAASSTVLILKNILTVPFDFPKITVLTVTRNRKEFVSV
ncbi:MAG TPA: hypothetical protein P5287_06395, partial [bacterium]|nr:hypothetical protein [bacterium]